MSPADKLKATEGDLGQGDRLNQKKYNSQNRKAYMKIRNGRPPRSPSSSTPDRK